ncbi:hypothetical protein BGZ58_008829 [Dissophora ornata]|nr:hypothetical protein BGZ58_008829 [Dissophora ornata]
MSGHAYSVLNAVEYKGERLVLVRNPWGEVEWNGDWSDDSDKWTPEAMKQLNHKESDDGQFWMSYKDFLRVFTTIDRCRIFDSTWSVASSWITYNVKPRSSGKFELEIKKGGETVIVLTQPDSRYYGAHLSEYNFNLSFHVYDTNKKLVKRSKPSHPYSNRSANCEVKLKPGKYTVIPIVISKSKEVKEDDSVSTKARLQGRVLLGVDEEDFEEIIEVEEKGEKWQVTIGLRVYTHNPDTTLEGVAGEHPSKKKEETKEVDDPESVTATLAGKKTENKDGEETAKEKKEEEEEKKTEEKTEEKKEEKEEEEKEEKEEEEEAKKVVGKDKETEKEEGKEEETKKEEGKEEDTKKVEGKEETKEEENAEKNEGEKLAEAEKEE